MSQEVLVGITFAAVLIIVIVAVSIAHHKFRFRNSRAGEITQGRVISVRQNGRNFEETVQFTTKDGRTITGTPMVAITKRSRMGERVSVFYDPEEPERFAAGPDPK